MKPDTLHHAANQLLPWVANGTASMEDLRLVEAHVKDCADCREELIFLRQLDHSAEDLDASLTSPTDSFAKTMESIEKWEAGKSTASRGGLRGFLESLWIPSPRPVQAILLAQLVLILCLGGFLLLRLQNQGAFTTLSGGSGNVTGVRLDVAFHPGATEEAIRQVLLEGGATIVSGPSAIGVYVVVLTGTPAQPNEVDAVIQQLRAKPDIIRFVERQP